MMQNPYAGQTIYQAESSWVPVLHEMKERAASVCMQAMNRHVRIQTISGQVFEGVIVHVDEHHVHLQIDGGHPEARAFLSPFYYNQVILPLVLYELLVITLLLI